MRIFGESVRPVNILVTDVEMPDGNGADLAATLKGIRKDVGVLLITGSSIGITEPTVSA
jgi:FixJ family two-component response regulator